MKQPVCATVLLFAAAIGLEFSGATSHGSQQNFLLTLDDEADARPLYLDQTQPVEDRVQDLMSRMTLQERQNQLFSVHNVDALVYTLYQKTSFGAQKLSGFSQTTAAELVAARNQEQEFFVNHSRLHIPLVWHQETLNSCGPQGTLFPLPVSIGSTWNVSLARQLGEVLARECRAFGIDAAYSPEVNLYTDPRNGRLQEGFSEDPRLTAELAVAQVLGEQGAGPGPLGPRTYLAADKVAAVGKHYIGYGGGAGGINSGPAHISTYSMRDIYLAPWRSMVQRAGLRALMRSHEQWDHWPIHASTELPQWIESIGFNDSWSISDCGDIVNLVAFQVAANNTIAGAMALKASVDVENQCPPGCFDKLVNAVQSGLLSEATLNRSVARVLRHKFSAGVFDDQMYTNTSLASSVLRSPAHLSLALEAARQSIVLLKNGHDDGTAFSQSSKLGGSMKQTTSLPLPLDVSTLAGKTVAILGPNGGCADDPNPLDSRCDGTTSAGGCQAQCSLIGKTFHEIGDGVAVPTVFETIKSGVPSSCTVEFARGANINTNLTANSTLEAPAVELAKRADVIIMVLGDSMQSASENAKNGASVFNDGGGGDRDNLDLPGNQMHLLSEVLATRPSGTPVIIVLVNGRQVTFDAFNDNALLNQADAVIAAWRGGEFGAQAIWDVLSGAFNPSGRLSQSWPRNIGQLGGPSSPNLHTVVADWGKATDQFERSYFFFRRHSTFSVWLWPELHFV
eukprot:INCI12748.2.p1 GENE.INCI12748.2~~INCI12748.2.p1  ORF type:complete len:736 (+),score=102.65 INCI12748.2:88-2295(+)